MGGARGRARELRQVHSAVEQAGDDALRDVERVRGVRVGRGAWVVGGEGRGAWGSACKGRGPGSHPPPLAHSHALANRPPHHSASVSPPTCTASIHSRCSSSFSAWSVYSFSGETPLWCRDKRGGVGGGALLSNRAGACTPFLVSPVVVAGTRREGNVCVWGGGRRRGTCVSQQAQRVSTRSPACPHTALLRA